MLLLLLLFNAYLLNFNNTLLVNGLFDLCHIWHAHSDKGIL